MLFGLRSMLQWKPDVEEFTAPLSTPRPFRFRIERFSKGIDNAHIDVLLSPRFTQYATQLIRNTLGYDAKVNLWRERGSPPDARQVENFTKAYAGMMETGTGHARKSSRPEIVQLLQFATMKFLLLEIESAATEHRENIAKTASGGSRSGADHRTAQAHDRLVILAREENALKFRTLHRIFGFIYKTEATILRRSRKGVLGRSWPVPKEMLFNPVMQLPSLWATELLMKNYTPLGINEEDLREFDAINRIITSAFQDYLPAWAIPASKDGADTSGVETGIGELRQRRDQGGLDGFLQVELVLSRALNEVEYKEGRPCWLDEVENIQILTAINDVEWERRRDAESRQDQRNRHNFALYLRELILTHFEKHKLDRLIAAANRTPTLYESFNSELPVRLIMSYLNGEISRRKMARRLGGMRDVHDPDGVLKKLEKERQEIAKLPRTSLEQQAVEYVGKFLTLRRDLKLAYQAYWIMNQIRLLHDEEQITLSRGNGSLQEYYLADEQQDSSHRIRNHTILKADLRGSTKVTAQLRENNLNPATHFSLNFFDPVTKLLEQFGASKVFVEGDAIILVIYEYDDEPYDWLPVARCCGLARKILDVVDANNARNRKYNLPELELGLGICFKPEAPAFLYDGDHQIMISSAINRADRLSGCAASLRKTRLAERRCGVEVVAPVEQGIMQKSSSDNLLRYNVNGIELDEEAFNKVRREISLREIRGKIEGFHQSSSFYVGRYPDKRNAMQWLVIREAPIRLWIGNDVSTEEEQGRRFYEVISDPKVLTSLKELAGRTLKKTREVATEARATPQISHK
jgi:hypothetical protein